jgi:N-acetylglutamate synthase-like GNAT family acetyltransferase
MAAAVASPEMRALMSGIAAAAAESGDPAAAAAGMAPAVAAAGATHGGAIDRDACIVRRGRLDDVPALARLIIHGELPPMFLEEFVEGFCVVEHRGEIVGCGGLELYGPECAVIRSVVTHERARGLGLGGRIGRLLVDDARAYGANDIYLFTLHAVAFWEHLGFRHLELDDWRPEARANWQYIFCSSFPEAVAGVRSMWMAARR